jgi:hypothetical protein
MGASAWRYFVPYQPDLQAALEALREAVFAAGRYYRAFPFWRHLTFEQSYPIKLTPDLEAELRLEWERLQSLPEPTSIETLLAWNQEEGTHSILDMRRVDETPLDPPTMDEWIRRRVPAGEDPLPAMTEYLRSETYRSQFGTVYPLTEGQLVELFGTTRPTREQVESRPQVYEGLRDRWVGLYIIVYRDGEPDEICFTGYSGD